MSSGLHSIANAGELSDLPPISVTSGSASSHSLSSGKNGVFLMNVGTKLCWFGGPTVDPVTKRGTILLPMVMIHMERAKADFKIYFKCAAGDSTQIGVVEYA